MTSPIADGKKMFINQDDMHYFLQKEYAWNLQTSGHELVI